MKIDIERLGKDLDYWNSVAPKGAECLVNDYFTKWRDDVELTWNVGGVRGWSSSSAPWSLGKYVKRKHHGFNVTMKPTPPAWNGQGLPPVGTVCEKAPDWHKCEIIATHDGGIIVYDMHDFAYYKVGIKMNFRPIKTPEQIQRDELIKTLVATLGISPNVSIAAADALIAAGYHK